MDKKKLASLTLQGGIVVLAIAALMRLVNISEITFLHLAGLWKVSVGLLLISIAASVSKD